MLNTFMTMMQNFIGVLTGGIVSVGEGIGSGIVSVITHLLFVVNSETGTITDLNAFGYLIALFMGISLSIGISKLVYHFVTSLGKNGN